MRRYCFGNRLNCCVGRKGDDDGCDGGGGGDDDDDDEDRWRSLRTLNTAVLCRISDSAGQKCALTCVGG